MEVNPRELLNEITLRSRKKLLGPQAKHKDHPNLGKETELSKGEEVMGNKEKLAKGKEVEAPRVPEYQLLIAYPAKVKKDQQEEQFKKSSDMFKTLHINIPFVEALSQIPCYTKFSK